MFWVLKRTVSLRRFFWVPTIYVLIEKLEKKISTHSYLEAWTLNCSSQIIFKDKAVLFKVAYNETDNISSRTILRHNNIFNRYLFASILRQESYICHLSHIPSRIAQSVMCLATDASLTADPGVASLILARSHTFVEIDHEIISTVILLPSAESFKKRSCQLQAKVFVRSTG